MNFACATCGTGFIDQWENQRKHDQDKVHGTQYGFCPRCLAEAEKKNEAEWLELETLVRSELEPSNQAAFDALELEVRRGIIVKMMEDGLVGYSVRRRA